MKNKIAAVVLAASMFVYLLITFLICRILMGPKKGNRLEAGCNKISHHLYICPKFQAVQETG